MSGRNLVEEKSQGVINRRVAPMAAHAIFRLLKHLATCWEVVGGRLRLGLYARLSPKIKVQLIIIDKSRVGLVSEDAVRVCEKKCEKKKCLKCTDAREDRILHLQSDD
ncbi:hypothetical protein MTP99_010277 [Tenebrio molitor]|nr:hypothetical protein MTP99_010277 [Tenebrio molitor]